MGSYYILVIRLILAVIISLVVCRMFFQNIPAFKIVVLAVLLCGLAYLFEYLRKVGKGDNSGS
jgi:hypothetical protein